MTHVVSMVLFILGFIYLGVNLKEVQVDGASRFSYENNKQSVRRVQTCAPRGLILDSKGKVLAANRKSVSIILSTSKFQKRSWNKTYAAISNALKKVSATINRPVMVSEKTIRRHLNQQLAMPLVAWTDIDFETLSRFAEHEREFPGFSVVETEERVYPNGALASHLLGYVGREVVKQDTGDEKINFAEREMRGRSGVEHYYDSYLRGVPGQDQLTVDARGYTVAREEVKAPTRGLDLKLNLDLDIQEEVEKQLEGQRGACVVLDPRDGKVLAMASAPGYDPNEFEPFLPAALYEQLAADPKKPLLNRACGGAYAPGSTFKPITALAGLSQGVPPDEELFCSGVYEIGSMKLHCARRWGHGIENMRTALRDSCNPYFCNLGLEAGTNALITAAHTMGLGKKTGIDFGVDMAGVVPTHEWKMSTYHEAWYPGDLAQMSIGQSMLLVSPLQMARVAGAVGTGYLVTPQLRAGLEPNKVKLPFPEEDLQVVRDGMKLVVSDGSGKQGGKDVSVQVAGKTGTAEVGKGETRRKNTWFIAFAPADKPTVAVAMVIEYGQSGSGTTAPRVGAVLRRIFNHG